MTCEECEQILLDSKHGTRAEGWMLRISTAGLAEAHVKNCPACATKMAEVARLDDALDQLRLSTMHVKASAAVERNLLDAFCRKTAKRRRFVGRAFAWRLARLSAAVLVLAVAGVEFYSSLRSHFPLDSENNRYSHTLDIQPPSSPRLSGAAADFLNENRALTSTNIPTTSRRHVAKHGNSRGPVVLRAPIARRDEPSLNGGGSIVRVTLPFSNLTAMGLPVRPDLSETRVTADVWVDPFGAVVGIRLVPAKTSAD
jgi:hypothetical protein